MFCAAALWAEMSVQHVQTFVKISNGKSNGSLHCLVSGDTFWSLNDNNLSVVYRLSSVVSLGFAELYNQASQVSLCEHEILQ